MGLAEEARRAAQRLTENEYVRIVARRSTDAVAAAALLAVALDREGVDFHLSFVADLVPDEVQALADERPSVLLTIGCGAEDAGPLAKSATALVVIDEVDPLDTTGSASLTPAVAAHAGEPAVASLAFVLARAMSKRNSDLVGLALAGARASAGPAGGLRELDAEILAEAEAEKRLMRGSALAASAPLLDTLASGLEPFLPAFAGRARVAKKWLDEQGVDVAAPASTLAPDDRRALAEALARRALADGLGAGAVDTLLEPDLRPLEGPFAGAPLRETAARLAVAADTAPHAPAAYALGRGPAPILDSDLQERALHAMLAAARANKGVAEAPSPAHLAETTRRLHAIDPARPAVAWAIQDGHVHARVLGSPGPTVVDAAALAGGRGAGSATRGRARFPAEGKDRFLQALGVVP